MSNVKEKVKEMAMLSVLANRVSEVQTKNLQTFPFVFFNEVKEASIDYDLAHRSTEKTAPNGPISKFDSRVTYHLTLNEGANANLEKRFFALQESVRVLFWKDITVEVYLNGKKYESKNG